MVLETTRLLLRPYEPADAAAFFILLDQSRERLKASFPDRLRAVPTLEAAPAQLAAFADDWRTGRFYVLGIWLRESLDYLGDICLMPQRRGQAEIGYYLAAGAEGHGYAREALAAMCRFGFGRPVEAQRLLIRCFADNMRACRSPSSPRLRPGSGSAFGTVSRPPPPFCILYGTGPLAISQAPQRHCPESVRNE
jgi:ribosomal-protein-alanine N-acetyltransferase